MNRARPARSPAASAPTMPTVGVSMLVMTSPLASVLTAVLKNRRSNGDSGSAGARTRRSKAAPSVVVVPCAATWYPTETAHAKKQRTATAVVTRFETRRPLFTFTILLLERAFIRASEIRARSHFAFIASPFVGNVRRPSDRPDTTTQHSTGISPAGERSERAAMVSLFETTALWLLHERQPSRQCRAFRADVGLQAFCGTVQTRDAARCKRGTNGLREASHIVPRRDQRCAVC